MFWRKWVVTDIDLSERLSRLAGTLHAGTFTIPPMGMPIVVYTDAIHITDAILDVFEPTKTLEAMRVGYFTDPELFRSISGWTGAIDVGLSLVNPSGRTLVAFGVAGRGYLKTTIRGMCHLEVDPKGFVPVHGAILENGVAIIGPSGAGKSTLGLRLALKERIAMMADDWSCWQVGAEVRATRVADPMAISAAVFSVTRHLLPPDVSALVERELRKKAKVRIGHALFPVAPDSVVIRRVFLATKVVDQDLVSQIVHSNYHIPFVFPWSKEAQSAEFIRLSNSPRPFVCQERRVAAFWANVRRMVPVTALDTNGPIESSLSMIQSACT